MSEYFDETGRIERIDVSDRGLHYGDGLFETIAVRHGRARLWARHMQRLIAGCQRLGLPRPDETAICQLLEDALRETSIATDFCTAKILLTAGSGPRGYRRPETVRARQLLCVSEGRRLPDSAYRDGVIARCCTTRLADQPLLAGLKTLNRLEQVLGRAELTTEFEGIMFDAADNVICGTMSNVIVISKQQAWTPALNRCGVAGVARGELLHRAHEKKIPLGERDVSKRELQQAEAVLLTNSQFGAVHLCRLDGQSYTRNALSESLVSLLCEAGFPEVRP